MTTIGKILVGLHLVLSIFFMAFAGAVYTAQKNWRTVATTQTAALAKATQKQKDLQAEIEKERTETKTKLAEQTNEITKLTGEKTALDGQAKALDADNKRLNVALDGLRDQTALSTTEADERKKEADLQREKNSVLYQTREELIASLQKASDEKFALDLQLQQLLEKHDRLLADVATMKRFLSSKNLTTDPKLMLAQVTPPPPLEGLITDYRKDPKGGMEYVEISLGSDENLNVGHKMTAYSASGKYLGQIRLTQVYPDKSVGIVVKEEKAKNVTIQKGDHVTTKL
jgi:chromosome segregation ATPase